REMGTRRWSRVVHSVVALSLVSGPLQAEGGVAFVTSVARSGNLGSWPEALMFGLPPPNALDAADNICRNLAAAVPLPNANKLRAWVSTSSVDAYCHLFGL